jgi:hypothetical protein
MNHRKLSLALAALLLWTVSVSARDDGGQKYSAPPDILPTLPKICWWLYMDNVPNTPEFNILDCGAYSNHYCPGLVNMKRAEQEKIPWRILEQLNEAKANMEYTLHWTKDIPGCSVRLPAQMNLQRINFQIDMLKLKAQKR